MTPKHLAVFALCSSLIMATACAKSTEQTTQDSLQKLVITPMDFNRSHRLACDKNSGCSLPLVCLENLCRIPPSVTHTISDKTPRLAFSTGDARREIFLEIAADDYSRQKGMMNRKTCHPDWGMLFIFPNDMRRSFWMSHTYIPLDIIFIDKDGRISNFYQNAKPLDETPRYTSHKSVRYVLELPGGSVERFGIDNTTTFDVARYNDYKAE